MPSLEINPEIQITPEEVEKLAGKEWRRLKGKYPLEARISKILRVARRKIENLCPRGEK